MTTFFLQAEDGIRDADVTGVQTCALPIFEGVVFDDACDPKQAVAVANRIVNEGISFVVGHLCSSSTQPATDIYEDEGILMVTPAATSPDITARGYQLVFRTIGLDSLQGPTAGKYIVEQVKPQKVAEIGRAS